MLRAYLDKVGGVYSIRQFTEVGCYLSRRAVRPTVRPTVRKAYKPSNGIPVFSVPI